jgi:putative ABC transport system permease protein
LQDLRLIANAIIGAVVFTLVLVTASTMRQSVRQRSAEFAILMTVGFAPMRIALMVTIEAVLLCLPACMSGLLVAAIAFPSVSELFGSMKLQPEALAFAVMLAIFIAAASAVLPALRASRLSIVDALAGRGA